MRRYGRIGKGLGLVLLLAMLVLAACNRKPGLAPTPTATPSDTLPENSAAVLIQPEQGGTVSLRDGASVTVPGQVIAAPALVTLRARAEVPPAPVPRSIIGRVYDISLEGGSLTGIATLTLPLPVTVGPDQYDVAAYLWDGKAWQRRNERLDGQSLRLGIDGPGTFAVLGSWRMADAALALNSQSSDLNTVEARGQYRYTAAPTTQHDYVEARLALKRDSSGGAGQVSGVEEIDQTIAETVLWFKPDPMASQGIVDFNHSFVIDPATPNVPLGTPSRLYASLEVLDSPAPTRRLSSGIDYTVQIPIRAEGTEIVGPDLPANRELLVWHVRLNGQTLFRRRAASPTLSLSEVLAQGGLGEYKITLDSQSQDTYVPVSNEITVELAVPNTPAPVAQAPGSGVFGTPTVWPFGPMPPTPTRRAPPIGTPSALEGPTRPVTATLAPGVTPTPTPTPTPTRMNTSTVFWAEQEQVAAGGCTTLHWNIENVSAVYLDGAAAVGVDTRQVCPVRTTTYTLRAIDLENKTQEWRVTVLVGPGSGPEQVVFTADEYQIVKGSCTTLRWRAVNVLAVYLNDEGVGGEETREVCPTSDKTYVLRVQGSDNETTRRLTVWVLPSDSILASFWAGQYTLEPGGCTTLNWAVQNVDEVFLRVRGKDTGVQGVGSDRVCPNGTETYSLVVRAGDQSVRKDLAIQAADVQVGDDELIAQGTISELVEVNDLDPDTSGDVPGYRIVVDGIVPLVKGSEDCCNGQVTLLLARSFVTSPDKVHVDWPMREGQQIEFRLGPCTEAECRVFNTRSSAYLKLRSQ